MQLQNFGEMNVDRDLLAENNYVTSQIVDKN